MLEKLLYKVNRETMNMGIEDLTKLLTETTDELNKNFSDSSLAEQKFFPNCELFYLDLNQPQNWLKIVHALHKNRDFFIKDIKSKGNSYCCNWKFSKEEKFEEIIEIQQNYYISIGEIPYKDKSILKADFKSLGYNKFAEKIFKINININLDLNSSNIVKSLRSILENPKPKTTELEQDKEKAIARTTNILLVALLFVIEPARNLRALPINLMLFDLIEKEKKYGRSCKTYNFQQVLYYGDTLEKEKSIALANILTSEIPTGDTDEDVKSRRYIYEFMDEMIKKSRDYIKNLKGKCNQNLKQANALQKKVNELEKLLGEKSSVDSKYESNKVKPFIEKARKKIITLINTKEIPIQKVDGYLKTKDSHYIHLAGGKLPVSPKFSMNPQSLLTQAKEVSILIRWLHNKDKRFGYISSNEGVKVEPEETFNDKKSAQTEIKNLIKNRYENFDCQLT